MALVRSGRTAAVVGSGPLARAIEARCRAAGWPVTHHDPIAARLRRGAMRRCAVVIVLGTYSDVEPVMSLTREERIGRMRHALELGLRQAQRGAHLIYVTSAIICGTRPDGGEVQDADPLTEDPGRGLVAELLAIRDPLSAFLASAPGTAGADRRIAITELRLAALAGPGVDTVITRQFEAPRLLQVLGGDMHWQFVHSSDVGQAVVHVIERRLDGYFTVGAQGTMPMTTVCDIAGMRTLTLSRTAAFEAADRLHSVGMIGSPVADLSVVVEPWPVTSAGLRASGWRPQHSNEECLRTIMADVHARPLPERRAASAGLRAGALSAGAAIAAFGTAALVRRGRRR